MESLFIFTRLNCSNATKTPWTLLTQEENQLQGNNLVSQTIRFLTPTQCSCQDGSKFLGFENQTQSNLSTLFNGLGVYLTRNGKERFGTPLMLDQSTCPAKVVHTCLQCGQWIQLMLGTKSESVLISWESMGHFSTNSSVGQGVNYMVICSIQSITFVIPEQKNSLKYNIYTQCIHHQYATAHKHKPWIVWTQ